MSNGGPAFPNAPTGYRRYESLHDNEEGFVSTEDVSSGMSLRDWYAGRALTGMLGNALFLESLRLAEVPATADITNVSLIPYLSAYAYKVADAMIRARET